MSQDHASPEPETVEEQKTGGGRRPSACSPSSAHDKAWEKGFIVPIAKEMKARGVAYLLITIREDGKAAYVLEPVEAECQHASISDRGFLYPNYTCHSCGKQFGEDHPGNVQAMASADEKAPPKETTL